MYNPVSTYRIQFHKGFTLNDFERLIPYLEKLGVKTIYASPIFKAAPGSMHGYDSVDPLQINPEIGTIRQLREIGKKLKAKNIGWIQDIVPNHMAYHQDNKWLMDVLEKGPSSAYKAFFDNSMTDELLFKGPIMVPFLGSDLDEVINNGELLLERHGDKLVFKYAGQVWPLKDGSCQNAEDVAAINRDKEYLKRVADQQYYRLCSYKETDSVINFRRFFTVNSLICLNIQDELVFEQFHRLVIQLLKDGIFQGLRVDHIDGLYDPAGYLQQLRKAAGDEAYIIVEKILEKGEQMPLWPIEGSTGYDFLALVNNLLTGKTNKDKFNAFYQTLCPDNEPVSQQVHDKKAYILARQMAGELDNLTRLFLESNIIKTGNVSTKTIQQTIAQFLINCPEYRFYGNSFPLGEKEEEQVKKIFAAIKDNDKKVEKGVELLEAAFFHSKHNAKALHFYMRCMQFTGPLMAKGIEDTLMYTYNRFVGHNEVGDSPDAFSINAADFHEAMLQRQKHWRLSMNSTATHDTKRGEDVRARLNVLPDMATDWLAAVNSWKQLNRDIKEIGAPDANDEYFIYQTLMGAYPMPGEDEDDFGERLRKYLQKTLREAKLHSNWSAPNEKYEKAVQQFASGLLDKNRSFWKSFTNLHNQIAEQGIINSLTQVILKFTCPGIPDTYQGCEHWDLSLVDPDNRRAVDYEGHKALLTKNTSLPNLWKNKFNGHIKLWLTQLLLQERKSDPLLFAEGEYIPLEVKGKYQGHVFAFARSYQLRWLVTVVPLNIGRQTITDWEDTRIIMPANVPEEFKNLVLKSKDNQKGEIKINTIFTVIPFALLKHEYPDSGRGSGVLMHITSLPSEFGIGDFGAGAKAFADMLHKAYQKYWQVLPLNPVDQLNNYSPYSVNSAMAGNTLLLSPELLAMDGGFELEIYLPPPAEQVDFKQVLEIKQLIFDKAWAAFKDTGSEGYWVEFAEFCKKESEWLNDHAIYNVLKKQHDNEAWYKWPDKFRSRSKKALTDFEALNSDAIAQEKWLQYQFSKQWSNLKLYCNQLNIQLFGDLPFYVSYDSVDVWAHPELFNLDDNGNMMYVAGVPPDYFSTDGQLWGMPVFRWDKLKAAGYWWWVKRIRQNLMRFDLLRLDHFRAFANYWAVPAADKTAVNGKWEPGPGTDFFDILKKEFGRLPFVAEDLGTIDEAVYQLRDAFELPGMRVLQFAFGKMAAQSPHAPQNYIVNSIAYTGTHDNNTTKGWYRNETDKASRKQLKHYTGTKVNAKNINKNFTRLLMASVAKLVIIPMQDILDLEADARMNKPGAAKGNWQWRLNGKNPWEKSLKKLKRFTQLYNRA